MTWTTPDELTRQLQKLWDQGVLLRESIVGTDRFPLRLMLRKPTSGDLSLHFDEVRQWIAALRRAEAQGFRIEWRGVRHKVIGANRLPDKIWLESPAQAIAIIGRQKQARRYREIVDEVSAAQPALAAWLAKYPLRTLDYAVCWRPFLTIIGWLQRNPRPGVYLRQIDLPDIDSKFIEQHRGILAGLLDLTLAAEYIDCNASGVTRFNQRYGFRDKPLRVRFRLADQPESDQEIDSGAFARLSIPANRVFIIENEISFLAFPTVADSLLIFGRGYGFDMLAPALWLRRKKLYYWGDIDTHGFAILNQFRQLFPHTCSLLMDEATLLAHRDAWGREEKPCLRQLASLDEPEQALYQALREHRFAQHLRLEQERIAARWLRQALDRLDC